MLLALIHKFTIYEPKLNALTYLSSRAILALITSILISLSLYPPFITRLRALKLGQPIRELGPATHQEKKGTPTMGGVVILFATLSSALLWTELKNHHLWTLTIVSVSFGLVGFLDDYLKISKKNPKGLASRYKYIGLSVGACIALAWHFQQTGVVDLSSSTKSSLSVIYLPFLKEVSINLGWLYLPFAYFVLVGSSNAVNLTDGLDGLVIGPVITCSIALLVLSYVTGNVVVAKYLYYHTVAGSGEITVFLAALIGSSIGFLWYNTWPAQVFMGDSGALPLGGILGAVAMITGHEILLVIMGGVFVVEALSVIIQVGSFKMRQKRVFRMAPIHHHFEKGGWPEQKITVRAWIISLVLALVSILTLKLR
ncbi:phospho-N-acetylmuramoyl-pentapeptide-transferase [bacterium]|nr:phospho-N-acetylmuramoyl-pentapeptide-transferase [bacterium]